MKLQKLKYLIVILVASAFSLQSCADLSVDNLNEPDRDAVLADVENTLKLLNGAYQQVFAGIVTSWAAAPHMLADQATSTNLFRQYWDFAEEPRLRMNNTTSYSATASFSAYWGAMNSGIATANILIDAIVNDEQEFVTDGVNVTDQVLAQAYFIRGIARGYLGLIYDQAYLVDENTDLTQDPTSFEFSPYTDLIDAAVADIVNAVSSAENAPNFVLNTMPNGADSWNFAQFSDIAHSYAAKFSAGKARTADEAASMDWGAILSLANKGLGGPEALSSIPDFTAQNVGSDGTFANYMADWLNFVVTCSSGLSSCAGYNPVDVKMAHMLDPEYPTEYPANLAGATAGLEPAESDDQRLEYFVYTTNPGFLNPNRNANLYTNYFSLRFFANNDWWPASYGVTLFTSVENDLLRAEASLMSSGNSIDAAQILNETPAGTGVMELSIDLPANQIGFIDYNGLSGGHNYLGTESIPEIQWALLREYSIEIDQLGGVGTQWFFMRRHDLLQAGTPTHFAVPGSELELLQRENYTFGGVDFAGEPGTASGANNWKDLAEQVFGGVAAASGGNVEASGEYLPYMGNDIPAPAKSGNETRRNQ